MTGKFFGMIASLALVHILWPDTAWGYLDGGTGSMLLQLLAGGIAGIAVISKFYLHKIRSYWQHFRSKRKSDDQ